MCPGLGTTRYLNFMKSAPQILPLILVSCGLYIFFHVFYHLGWQIYSAAVVSHEENHAVYVVLLLNVFLLMFLQLFGMPSLKTSKEAGLSFVMDRSVLASLQDIRKGIVRYPEFSFLNLLKRYPEILPVFYLLFVGLIILFYREASGQWLMEDAFRFFAVIVAVPIAEEILFRGWLTSWLTKMTKTIWAPYFSAILFASLHGAAVTSSVLWWPVDFFWGAFLLGLLCESLLLLGFHLRAAIYVHMAANLSVYLFASWAPSFLEDFHFLFISS